MLAADDPLVPLGSMEGIDWQDCPAVLPLPVAGGGHCGFYDWRAEAMSVRAIGGFFEGVAAGQGSPTAALSGPPDDQNPGRGVSSIITWSSPPSTRISPPLT